MQRSARAACRAFAVKFGGDTARGGIDPDNAVQSRTGAVIGFDPRQVPLDQLHRTDLAVAQQILQFGDGYFMHGLRVCPGPAGLQAAA